MVPQRGRPRGGKTLKIADTSAQDVPIAPKTRPRRVILSVTALLALLVIAWLAVPVVGRWATATVSVPAERLRLATVERGDLVRDVSVQGRVVAAVSPRVYAPAAGTITLLVEAGATVTRGDVLATIDSPDLANALQQAESTLAQQQVELERQRIESRQFMLEKRKQADLANVALVAAEREKRRADRAHEIRVISIIDFEKAQDDLQNAELAHAHAVADAELYEERLAFELEASELAVERQRLLVADLRRQVDALSLRSPVNGMVGDLLVEQKAAVIRDAPVMAVVDLSRFEIDAQIPESYADDLALGMPAEIVVGAERYAGTLTAVSPEIVDNQVSARIRFADRTPPNLRQNQRLATRVLLEERNGVLVLPRGQFLDSGGGRIAYVLDGQGLAHRRRIAIGARSLGAVEVVDGLSPGDVVVISSIDPFRGAEQVFISD